MCCKYFRNDFVLAARVLQLAQIHRCSMPNKIAIKIINPKIGTEYPLPHYATDGSAAVDLHACIDIPLQINPGEVQLIPAGFAMHINDSSIAATILPRSGLGHKHGIVLGNLTGLIDSDYQGEIKISCWNRSEESFMVNPGDRIAQLMFLPIINVAFDVVSDFIETTRGEQGFGHTGIGA